MKSAIVAAVVATLVAAGASSAAALINGRSIRPHSIPLNRLAHLPAAGISHVRLVEGSNVTVDAGSATGRAEADCPNGWTVLGGGGYASEGVLYSSDESTNGRGWVVELDNSNFAAAASLSASVICGRS